MLMRVSHVEAFRRWRMDEAQTLEDFIRYITVDEPSEAMKAGTALHKALEVSNYGDVEQLQANGYTFLVTCDISIELPCIRELRSRKDYGSIEITGQVDALNGVRIDDHKTTSQFHPERYLEGCQWKFYLDIFEADLFRWNVFEMRELKPKVYEVFNFHRLEQYRYPALAMDCRDLAEDLAAFVREYLPEMCAEDAIAA